MSLLNTPEITVNGKIIPTSNIDAEMQYHPAENRRQAMISAAESLILKEVVKQRAAELSLPGIKLDDELDAEKEYLLVEQLLELDDTPPKATEEECQHYYDANPERFYSTPIVEVKHILLAADPQDLAFRNEQQQLAEQLIQQLNAKTAVFDELVEPYSDCPSKTIKGNLGQISQGQTVPEFQKVIFASAEGLIPFAIESRYGFHIALITKKIEGEKLPYEFAKEKIANYLQERVKRKAISQYLHRLVAEADIKGFAFDVEPMAIMQ